MLYLLQVYLLVTVLVAALVGAVAGVAYAVAALALMFWDIVGRTVRFLHRVFPRADAAPRTIKYSS